MPVITVSGNLGSGAREVGQELANKLKLDYVDNRLLVDTAQRLGVSVERVAEHDERTLSFGERVSAALRSFLERSATMGATDPMLGASGLEMVLARSYEEEPETTEADVSDQQYVKVLTSIMQELAARGDVVIVGRGSHVILKDHPGAIHINLVAPRDMRVQNVIARDGITPEEAPHRVERNERGRISYHRKLFQSHPDDPNQYHVSFNGARMSQDEIVNAVLTLLQTGVGKTPVA